MSNWTEWKDIEKLPKDNKKSAIYQIRLKPEKASKYLWHKDGIPRLLGCDPDYILSIGKTTDSKVRIRKFKTAMKDGKDKTHSEGRTLYLIKNLTDDDNKTKKFDIGFSDVQYRYREVDKYNLSKQEESQFKKYIQQYGEVPPLNGCIPGRKDLIDGL